MLSERPRCDKTLGVIGVISTVAAPQSSVSGKIVSTKRSGGDTERSLDRRAPPLDNHGSYLPTLMKLSVFEQPVILHYALPRCSEGSCC